MPALLRQKETSDISSKSELLMFCNFTQCALLPGQFDASTLILLRDMLDKASLYQIDVSCSVIRNLTFVTCLLLAMKAVMLSKFIYYGH